MLSTIIANILRWAMAHLCPRSLDVAEISTFRDPIDVKKFGFQDAYNLPDFFLWARHKWGGVRSALYMIGSTTEHVTGDNAEFRMPSFTRGQKQFMAAVSDAVNRGAKVILLAAATKRLFLEKKDRVRLQNKFPGVIFTLGDNMTGLLLVKRIEEAARLTGLDLSHSRVLVIGPYGLLGSVASFYLTKMAGATVVGLGNPKRKDLLEKMSRDLGIIPAYGYDQVGRVDLVIACNSSKAVVLTPERVDSIRMHGKKLVVIDPSEPYALSRKNFAGCEDRVIRFDAGNGFSQELKYVPFPFGAAMYRILRLAKGVTWGCFCEAMILARNIESRPRLGHIDWFEITPGHMKVMEFFFGPGKGKFTLPKPTCFSREIRTFDLTVEKTRRPVATHSQSPAVGRAA